MGVSIRCYSRIWDFWQDPIPGLIQTKDQGEVERRCKDDIIEATICNFAAGLGGDLPHWHSTCVALALHHLFGTLQAT